MLPGQVRKLWAASAPLVAVGFLMLIDTAVCLIGLVLDPRLVTGAPVWMKPLKFAISTGAFAFTMAWIFRYINAGRLRRRAGWILAIALVIEIAIIDIQAARGTASHFNISTPLDAALWGIMGSTIAVLAVVMIWLTVALFRRRFTDPAWGWTLRMAMLVTVLSFSTGAFMTGPTASQTRTMQAGQRPIRIGGHTVGAPDGGPGLPVTGWSADHGDVRVSHFLGLHALQLIPLAWWLLTRRRRFTERRRTVIALEIGIAYISLVVIAFWQALRGEALTAPSPLTLWVFALWLLISLGALIVTTRSTPRPLRHTVLEAR
jgi:hypothetical protein